MSWRRGLSKFGALFRRRKPVDDIAEEIRSHLEMEEQENLESGMTPEEAHYAALRRFGNVTLAQERSREMWGWNWVETLWQDLRFGLRQLRKTPGFTAVTVITLALGIGANTAIFSVIDAVLLRPLPFPHADRLVQIWETDPKRGLDRDAVSAYNFRDWQSQNHGFAAMAAYGYDHFSVTSSESPIALRGLRVSADFFRVFGARPLWGRDYLANEDQPGAGHVAVVSFAAWQNYFGRDPKIVGRKITLDGEAYTVIGVMPSGFGMPDSGIEIWITPAFDLKGLSRGHHGLFAIGRLKPGITLAAARSEANTIARRLAQQYPGTNSHWGIVLIPLQEEIVGNTRPALLVLWDAVGLVLLIACANVASLLLSRGVARSKEFAVRSALGASRWRLAGQLLIESILLAAAGGVLGLAFAHWGIGAIVRTAAIPRAQGVTLDARVLGFTGLLSMLTGIVFGLAPAFASSSTDSNSALKKTVGSINAGAGGVRLRSGFVAAEIALSLVLLVSAGLLIKSLWLLGRVNPGFNPKSVLALRMSLPESKYPNGLGRGAVIKRVIERLVAVPGVESVAGVNDLPFSGSRTTSSFDIEGVPPSSPDEARQADLRDITPDYFKAMGIPLLKGRWLTDGDNADAPRVAIINENLARKYWPVRDPIGQRLRLYDKNWEIVGVVGGVKLMDLAKENTSEIYLPCAQSGSPPWMFFAVRSRVEGGSVIASVRNAVREVAPDEPLYDVRTMDERVAASTAPRRLNAWLLGIFAALALVLSAVGTYGVIAYSVAQRTHEFGIRMALGAERGDVLKLVLGQGIALTLLGVGVGLAGAAGFTRYLSSLLYGVRPNDALTFISVGLLLFAVVLLACYIPARRATKVDPMVALRYE